LARMRRARKRQAPGKHTMKEWRDLCAKYGNRCLACGAVPDKLSPDHVIPLSRGGSDDIKNIQPLCLPCNHRKHARTIDYRGNHENLCVDARHSGGQVPDVALVPKE
jgi:5-methylcytosine-specific restriction endonuclease McrA